MSAERLPSAVLRRRVLPGRWGPWRTGAYILAHITAPQVLHGVGLGG